MARVQKLMERQASQFYSLSLNLFVEILARGNVLRNKFSRFL